MSKQFPVKQNGLQPYWIVPLICLGTALLVLAAFNRTFDYGFIGFDDDFYVTENWHVLHGLSWGNVFWAMGAGTGRYMSDTDYWMPLSLISHMADVRFLGLNPSLRHIENVFIHALSAVLLFLVLRSLTGRLWRSAFVVAIWAIHPLRVESVAWISERKEVLGGLFFMLCLASYLRYTRRISFFNASILFICFLLGLMSKPTVVTLPLVLLLLDYWPLNRLAGQSNARRMTVLIREKIPLFALSLFSCIMTVFTQKQTLDPSGQIPLSLRVGNALITTCIYLKKTFYPSDLAIFYPYPLEGRPLGQVLAALSLLIIITTGAILQRRRYPYLLVGWLWYLVMLLPASGILKAGGQAYADRFTYLPQIGLSIALVWLFCERVATSRLQKYWLAAGATGTILLLLITTSNQTGFWRDSTTLFTHTLECTKDNALIHNNLGSVLWHQGKVREAIHEIEISLQINPTSAETQNNYGTILWEEGRQKDAIEHFRKALECSPSYAAAYNNLGTALLQIGQIDESIPILQTAILIRPGLADAHFNLGLCLLHKGLPKDAAHQFQEAIAIDPNHAQSHNSLGTILASQGKEKEGLAEFQKALAISPSNPSFENNVAWLLATCHDHTIRDGRSALQLSEDGNRRERFLLPTHLRTLAAALAQNNQYQNACKVAEKAIQVAEAQGSAELSETIRNEQRFYSNNSPIP